MPQLAFRVKVDAVIDGRALGKEHFAGKPDGVQCLLVGAWVGAGNPDFSLARLDSDGTATLSLQVAPQDVDTVKLAVSFNLYTPKAPRNCALASNFVPTERLLDLLRASAGKKDFESLPVRW